MLKRFLFCKDYVTEEKGIFLHPTNEDSDEVLNFNADGKLQLIPVDGDNEGNEPDFKMHNLVTGTFRKAVEMAHSALKVNHNLLSSMQTFKNYDSFKIMFQFWRIFII